MDSEGTLSHELKQQCILEIAHILGLSLYRGTLQSPRQDTVRGSIRSVAEMVFFVLFLLAGELCQPFTWGTCSSYHARYSMKIADLRLGLKSKLQPRSSLAPLASQGHLLSLRCDMKRWYKDRWICITLVWICGESQLLWVFFLRCCSVQPHELSAKWRERVKCDGLWECLPSFMQVFPARQLKNGNSQNRMHIYFCFLLIKKSVMTETICRVAALCLAMGLACLQERGLGAGEYQGTSLGPSHKHCRGEQRRSGWLLTLQSLLLFTSSRGHRSN